MLVSHSALSGRLNRDLTPITTNAGADQDFDLDTLTVAAAEDSDSDESDEHDSLYCCILCCEAESLVGIIDFI
jgi:hypothetical protein